ncbi:HlyD family efflux transporter periplasmic adaptor subunit [uncultured Dysosmobacter sp.]|uniref:HlyD family efflux transporter periplasmic adaptor subunit n=1 Tax=uncultured Dysosmobacter sp. TaxID=2591384 RepID=UPI002673F2C9|nr:HlyD family efflux transporter periplasmic adaptor subunit [uncultured Dysosmobacter sp.]
MAEIMEEKKELTPAETAVPAAPETPKEAEKSPVSKKKRRRMIRRIIALVVVAALIAGGVLYFRGKSGGASSEAGTATVEYGAISSVVDGSGLVKAKNSETISLTTAGTVMDVFVEEGQHVEQGDPLFTIDSPNASTEVQKARDEVEGYQKKLNTLQKNIADLNLTAPYAGKLLETEKLAPGDDFASGKVATLVDDTRMRLEQYYSYAYAGELKAGQKVEVSIPALMTTVEGSVEAVHMISRVTPEGSKLFSAEIVIPNAGVLAKDMVATATATINGDTVYPYEAGKLDYYRTTDLKINVSGTIISSNLMDYLSVSAGQVLVRIDGEDSETEIFDTQQALAEAQKRLETAQKNLDNCNAVAPISGQVIGLSVTQGQELDANTTLVTISDTSTVTISATVDERNISYIKAGMSVNLDQWGTSAFGTVETVSLSSSVNNGVASYPITISADNTEGTLQVNSYVNYEIQASQNDNCLMVPIQAVRTVGLDDGSTATVVYVQADSQPDNALELPYQDEEIPAGFYPVQVEIGIQDTYNVEIKSGLNEGDTVYTQMMTTEAWG